MPCVFPILSLKALSLARAGETATGARREALAYAAGVIATCLALGGAPARLAGGRRGGRLGLPASGSARDPAAAVAAHRHRIGPCRPFPAAGHRDGRQADAERGAARRLLHRSARRLRRDALHRAVHGRGIGRGPGGCRQSARWRSLPGLGSAWPCHSCCSASCRPCAACCRSRAAGWRPSSASCRCPCS